MAAKPLPVEDDTDPLAPPKARAARMDSGPLRQPVHRPLSDAELLAKYDGIEQGKYVIPPGFEPEGMVYEWKTKNVIGRENVVGLSEYARAGWQYVPVSRHPGYWTADDVTGNAPIELDGMVLMEIETAMHLEKQAYWRAKARVPLKELRQQLSSAPPGTAPRDAHPKTAPRLSRTYEQLPVER